MTKFLQCMFRILKWVLCLFWLLTAAVVLLMVAHAQFNTCPLHLRRFNQKQLRPVLYGLPNKKGYQAAARGEVILGGCIPRFSAAYCPYCSMPARFRQNLPSAISLDDETMGGLSAVECQTVSRYAKDILDRAQVDAEEKITAILVTPADVWLGTFDSGLHRFDRNNSAWVSFERQEEMKSLTEQAIGLCVKRIWQKGSRIYVKHEPLWNGLYYEDYTEDRGKTWVRD